MIACIKALDFMPGCDLPIWEQLLLGLGPTVILLVIFAYLRWRIYR